MYRSAIVQVRPISFVIPIFENVLKTYIIFVNFLDDVLKDALDLLTRRNTQLSPVIGGDARVSAVNGGDARVSAVKG